MAEETSPMFKMDTKGWIKVGKGALIAAGGAGLTYLAQNITGIDFGQMTPVIVSVASIVINAVRKWITKYE